MLILNAGVQFGTDFAKPDSLDLSAVCTRSLCGKLDGADFDPSFQLESEIYTNYTSNMIMISAFLPHLLKLAAEGKTEPRLVTVTSGLAVVPAPRVGKSVCHAPDH